MFVELDKAYRDRTGRVVSFAVCMDIEAVELLENASSAIVFRDFSHIESSERPVLQLMGSLLRLLILTATEDVSSDEGQQCDGGQVRPVRGQDNHERLY
jgi:hypothetical protein